MPFNLSYLIQISHYPYMGCLNQALNNPAQGINYIAGKPQVAFLLNFAVLLFMSINFARLVGRNA